MSLSAEQNLKNQIAENKKRTVKISKILKETYQQFQAEKELDGCLNTLIAAIDFLKEEQKKAIEINQLIADRTAEQATEILTEARKIVATIHQEKIYDAINQFEDVIRSRNNKFDAYLEEKLKRIEKRDHIFNNDLFVALKFIFVSVGSFGGIMILIHLSLKKFLG